MGVFKKVRNFLKQDGVRGALALGSGLAGMGAFDGMKYGGALTTGLGGLNIASGLSSGGVSGALQAGLGGYGLAQGMGKVGTFQDTYKSIFGGGNQSSITGPTSRPANPNLSATATGIGERPSAQSFATSLDDDGNPISTRSNGGSPMQFGSTTTAMNTGSGTDSLPIGPSGQVSFDQMASGTTQTPSMSNAQILTANQSAVGTGGGANMSTPGSSVFSGAGNQMAANANQMMVSAGGKSVPSFMVNGQQVVIGENGLMQSATDWVKQNTEGGGFSFKGVMDNIAEKAMEDPMQAFAVGSALVTAFAESPQEEAARLYADEVARVRAQTDPNSNFGQTFMSEYTQQRQTELNQQYTNAKADWLASMSAKGLTNSTIAIEGTTSLDAKFAELQSKLPMDAMQALQQYQNNQFKNLNLGLGPAGNQANLIASQSNPFSLASKGAVSSVGS